jgi:hypothetical protein
VVQISWADKLVIAQVLITQIFLGDNAGFKQQMLIVQISLDNKLVTKQC